MNVVHLVAGAGGMVCGSCLHGNTLAGALREAGQDVLLLPLYTPLRTDEQDLSIERVAFGGINVYLQQRWALFRHTPWFLDKLLDRPALLRRFGRRSSTTRAETLGAMTVSMLRGEEGRQRKELKKLVHWLKKEVRPDLIHLNNALLIGLARELNHRLSVPVVCSLSGEDAFLEKLPEPYYSRARDALRERSGDPAALVAMNSYFADFMAGYLAAPRERIRVIRPGLNLHGYPRRPPEKPEKGVVTIGYLSRICPEKGLHLLAEAVELLAAEKELPPFRLHAAGYLDEAHRPYLAGIERRLADCGPAGRFRYLGGPDRAEKIEFLSSLDVMSVPAVCRESKALSVLEAWAAAVPCVLPAHGAFPELIEDTGGGLLCEPNNPADLAEALKRMILQREMAAQCGRRAQQAVHQRYNAAGMARRTIQLYNEVCRVFV